jgi:hypothetical protein
MFALANVGIGALLVLLPVYAKKVLDGGATTYAVLASSLVVGDVIGSFVVAALEWRPPLGRSIAAAQASVGVGLLPLVAEPGAAGTVCLLALAGFLAFPLTIWAQSLRMRLSPPELRGRVFSLLRTAPCSWAKRAALGSA